ncbi:alpha/beta hydrolase [Mycobacterium sp. 236(2023)]|uniref:alpha/beta fold hydrolase n=1 Tax=Mycobacterium sp. 236(2023) TaxID=3038163 RepID=UPI00241560AB|nr:alpha/beta hydrolase [Mycobacterium sp. 236(2023)]MDG4665408.1 alpha/beta hydrolase [Mycobacterium sp. 236(2023)]
MIDPDKREFTLPDGARMAYLDKGSGPVVLLVHGVCMTSAFFTRNVEALSRHHRVVAVDLRSHGDSPTSPTGNTVAQYARDLHDLMLGLDLHDVTGVGWSMGSFVWWDHLRQFGTDRLSRLAVVSQGPADLTRPDWPYGIADPDVLGEYVDAMQSDFSGFFGEFVPEMFKDPVPDEDAALLLAEITKMEPNPGTVILADQTLRDYRGFLQGSGVPHLLVWGADEKVVKLASAEWLSGALADAELHVFDDSGHCPMWEEPDRFNELLAGWISRQLPSRA